MINKKPNIQDILNKELWIVSANGHDINLSGELEFDDCQVVLVFYSNGLGGVSKLLNLLNTNQILIIEAECWNGVHRYFLSISIYTNWFTGGWKPKVRCRDIIARDGLNVFPEINLIKLYIKNLDEFVGVTDDLKNISYAELNVGREISPINIGEVIQDTYLNFCFDWSSGQADFGYCHYNYLAQITPYVEIKLVNKKYIDFDGAKKLIHDFIALYGILRGKNEIFNAIEFNKYNNGEDYNWPRQWLIFSDYLVIKAYTQSMKSEVEVV